MLSASGSILDTRYSCPSIFNIEGRLNPSSYLALGGQNLCYTPARRRVASFFMNCAASSL